MARPANDLKISCCFGRYSLGRRCDCNITSAAPPPSSSLNALLHTPSGGGWRRKGRIVLYSIGDRHWRMDSSGWCCCSRVSLALLIVLVIMLRPPIGRAIQQLQQRVHVRTGCTHDRPLILDRWGWTTIAGCCC